MWLRAAVSIGIGTLGAGVALTTGLNRYRQAERAAVVAVAAIAALVANEAVRDGGLLA